MTADIHALSGAYALDALPDDERAFFERHRAACDTCRTEVVELQETAAMLASGVSLQPPPGLRDRVLGSIDVTRQLPPERPAPEASPARRTWMRSRILAPIAACMTLAVIGLGGTVVVLNERLDAVTAGPDASTMASVLGAADLETAELDLGAAAPGRFLYSPALDRGVLVAHGISDPGAHETYELWLIHDGKPVPAGLFRPDGNGAAVADISGIVRGAELVAVTIEPEGGSETPTGAILASAPLT